MGKNNKILEFLCILFVMIILTILGYYTYRSYIDKVKVDKKIEVNNFYDIDYLYNTGYLDNSKTISSFSKDDDIYIYLVNNSMYIELKGKERIVVGGLPSSDVTVYYNNLYDECYEFLAKTSGGDIFYAYVLLNEAKNYSFSLVDFDIKGVYTPLYDKKMVFVNRTSAMTTNFVLLGNDKKLKYIDFENGKYVLKDDLESKKPYFDYICASDESLLCNDLMIYLTFTNELVYRGEAIKTLNGDDLFFKNVFASLEVDSSKDVDLSNISFDELKKYNYLYKVYVVSKDDIFYQITISKDDMNIETINDSSNKVKQISFTNDELIVDFNDANKTVIKADTNKILLTSTIYDKIHDLS